MAKKIMIFALAEILVILFSLAAILMIYLAVAPPVHAEELKIKEHGEIKAIYLGSLNIFNKSKIAYLERVIATTSANAVVIDFKDSNSPTQEHMANLAKRFKEAGAYTVARIVVFQDTYFAKKYPEIAVKKSSGRF